ncbi:hypothetical protein K502DRAFT_366757 [Neoconidiobolus thromboides FSU 785]|nr:hypothetical protein K502DRAFT_366757 [Neoconidiobolus thromboides FSU 785]
MDREQYIDEEIELTDQEESNLPSTFKEYEFVIGILNDIINIKVNNFEERIIKNKLDEVIKILDQYQTFPNLLDPHLKLLVDKVLFYLRSSIQEMNLIPITSIEDIENYEFKFQLHDSLFLFLYHLTKIRGYKTIIHLFTHETIDLEVNFYYFIKRKQIKSHLLPWQSEYILLLWLSLIFMMPFDLKKLDSGYSKQLGYESLIDHVIFICKGLLSVNGKCMESGSRLLAQLVIRQDCITHYLPEFLEWSYSSLQKSEELFLWIGLITSLVNILKLGQREELITYISSFESYLQLFDMKQFWTKNGNLRQLKIKYSQQLGLLCLKPIVASWRYKRGFRTLEQNLHGKIEVDDDQKYYPENKKNETEKNEFEVPTIIENILENLFDGLKDKEVACRWSSAKGIGRIAQRLPKSFGEDIVLYLLNQYKENVYNYENEAPNLSNVDENIWHGLSYSIAELVRRGLIPKHLVGPCLKATLLALQLDIRRGTHSVGSNVRDAACYVIWCFSRAYLKEDFLPFVNSLSKRLVVMAVLDRESNVRRASSAAFQEFVGRVHIFPNGNELLDIIDYYSIANIRNSFLIASSKVTKYSHYKEALFEHMIQINSLHWDINVRRLTSIAVYNILPFIEKEAIYNSINFLLLQTRKSELWAIHGSLLTLSNLCLALSKMSNFNLSSENQLLFDEYDFKLTFQMIPQVLIRFINNGLPTLGSDIVLEGILEMIKKLAMAKWPINEEMRVNMRQLIDLSANRKEERIQLLASESMFEFSKGYGIYPEEIKNYLKEIDQSNNLYYKRGLALILGNIQLKNRKEELETMFLKLIKKIEEQGIYTSQDINLKKNCITSINQLLQYQLKNNDLSQELFIQLYYCILSNLKDYTITSQGDVGSHVRKEAMCCLHLGIKIVFDSKEKESHQQLQLKPKDLQQLIMGLLQQSCEKIDRLRECAGLILIDILRKKEIETPNKQKLLSILDIEPPIQWLNPASVFPNVIQVLKIPIYRKVVLSGILQSSGAITESLIKHAGGALIDYLIELSQQEETDNNLITQDNNNSESNQLQMIFKDILELIEQNQNNDRILLPIFEVLNTLFEAQVFQKVLNDEKDEFIFKLANCIRKEYVNCKQLTKIMSCCKVICQLSIVKNSEAKKIVWAQILRFLTFNNLKIRTTACEQTYMSLTSDNSENKQDFEWLEAILLETEWDKSIVELRDIVFPLYNKFGLLPPKLIKK